MSPLQNDLSTIDMPELPTVVLLAGPTAIGKTELSIRIAEQLGTEIVSADSMQVYRHMDIGTAKPTAGERSRVKHHLLDVVEPDEPFDAARFAQLACPIIDALRGAGRVPLVVGGTGLYLKVLTRSICPAAPGDERVRARLREELENVGPASLHAQLLQVDPVSGKRIHPHDRQRILRALEVHRISGIPLSQWQAEHRFGEARYPTLKIFLYRDREEMYERINQRVHLMIEQGLEGEVRRLLGQGFDPGLKSMQSLGYKEMVKHVTGRSTLEEAMVQIQKETRRYAKRQMTWFRADPEFIWLHAEDQEGVVSRILERGSTSPPELIPP